MAGDNQGNPLPAPSFVYRQVLDYALKIYKPGDSIFLAPANAAGEKTEHGLAYEYLKGKKPDCRILYPALTYHTYVDTRGNARYLKEFLLDKFRELEFELVCAHLHSLRAAYCFKKEGFRLTRIHRVAYKVTNENIASRWWYYKYKPLHVLYELLAFCRDRFMGFF
jgi:uncharacterized SAM-binding protein YcdF (DUF218 family)